MFETLSRQPDDPLLALIGLFKADGRPGKVDLGVGVYRDEAGATPVLAAVKEAEYRLWQSQTSKTYVAPEGDIEFVERLWSLVRGPSGGDDNLHAAGVQTPGGSGALRLAADLILHTPRKRIWLGLPTWPNHAGIFGAAGLDVATYPFFDVARQEILFDEMVAALERAEPGDAALLHACCHNPTGAVLSTEQWRTIAAILERRGVLPLVDLAYIGFGRGLGEDVEGLRIVMEAVPEMLVAVSASKAFGLYRERTGAVYALARSAEAAGAAQSNLTLLARTSYSMPPDHGAAIVKTILGDEALRRSWSDELATMRGRIRSLRETLADGLAGRWPALAAVAGQEGMFSLLPLRPEQVLALRAEHGIFMPTSGRINIAGLKSAEAAEVAARIAAI